MTEFTRPAKLQQADHVENFGCGQTDLDEWLQKYALASQSGGMSTVFVSHPSGESSIAGYYALCTGGVERESVPARVAKGTPRHPIPVIVLARLAVDRKWTGNGLGRALVKDALRRVAAVADQVGVRALLIHAKDEPARSFYMGIAEFEPSPTDELHLFLLMKDLKIALAQLA